MSDDNECKNNRPKYKTDIVYKDSQGKERWIEIGPSWEGKRGHLTTDIPGARLVQTPIEAWERIQAERKEKAQSQEPEEGHERSH